MTGTGTSGPAFRGGHAVQGNNPLIPVIPDPADNKLVARQLTALVPVGIENPVIHSHFKDSKMSLYQLCLNTKLFLDLGRQTGGPVVKSSLYAIGDFDT